METNDINQGASIEKLPFANWLLFADLKGPTSMLFLLHAFNRPSAFLGLGYQICQVRQ